MGEDGMGIIQCSMKGTGSVLEGRTKERRWCQQMRSKRDSSTTRPDALGSAKKRIGSLRSE
jgi:hypothetical protein